MSETIIVYCSGLLTYPILQLLVVPYAKKKIKERWSSEEETESNNKRRGRPKGSKNKPKEEKK